MTTAEIMMRLLSGHDEIGDYIKKEKATNNSVSLRNLERAYQETEETIKNFIGGYDANA